MRDHKNTIVTMQYNKFELTSRLLTGLATHEHENIDRVMVVDNGSSNENWQALLSLSYKIDQFPVSPYPRSSNEGFTLGANYGLKRACEFAEERDLIFLISNDVQINGKFIEQAENILLQPNPALVGNRHINFDSGWNVFDNVLHDYLEGYFLACTSAGWRDIGFFDARYAPMDYEDVDLSTAAKKLGYKLVSLNNPNITHTGAGTYGYTESRRTQTEINRKKFEEKWKKDT